jgi:hypothetical protein
VYSRRRAARRRTGSHHQTHALAANRASAGVKKAVAVLCSTEFPARDSEVASEQMLLITTTPFYASRTLTRIVALPLTNRFGI